MSRSMRAGGYLAARLSSRNVNPSRRTFAVYAAARKPDLIQDIYLNNLRSYKPPPQKADDAKGHVQEWKPPATPKSPEEANLASEMKSYEDSVVEVEGQAVEGETSEPAEPDYFEDVNAMDGKLSTGEPQAH